MADAAVVVTIYTDGETDVSAPPGVAVTIRYANAPGDTDCTCGNPIRQDDNGDWFHIDAAEIWGGDHTAAPSR